MLLTMSSAKFRDLASAALNDVISFGNRIKINSQRNLYEKVTLYVVYYGWGISLLHTNYLILGLGKVLQHIVFSTFIVGLKGLSSDHYQDAIIVRYYINTMAGLCEHLPGPESPRKNVISFIALQWRHNGHDSVSNHQPHDCLLNGLFQYRSKKTWKLRVTGLCAGNSPVPGEFPTQMASNAENVSIWWRHHGVEWCQEWGNLYVNY